MSTPRKATTQSEARRRAREAAASFRERETKLEQFAVDYFLHADAIEKIRDEADREIARIEERAEENAWTAQRAAAAVIVSMTELGVARSEVAARLGITTRDVKRATENDDQPESSAALTTDDEGSGTQPADDDASAGAVPSEGLPAEAQSHAVPDETPAPAWAPSA